MHSKGAMSQSAALGLSRVDATEPIAEQAR